MARQLGSFKQASNTEPLFSAPLDARLVVTTKTELYDYDFSYRGMPVAVTDENALYLLIGADPSLEASWRKIGEDSSVELTQAEYDALTTEEKNNGVVYYVTDGDGSGSGGSSYDDTELRNRIAALEAKLADYEETRLQMTDGTNTVDKVVLTKTYVAPTPPTQTMFDLTDGLYDVNGDMIMSLQELYETTTGAAASPESGDGITYYWAFDYSDYPGDKSAVKGLVISADGTQGPYVRWLLSGDLDWIVVKADNATPALDTDECASDAVGTIYYSGSDTTAPWVFTSATINTTGTPLPWA